MAKSRQCSQANVVVKNLRPDDTSLRLFSVAIDADVGLGVEGVARLGHAADGRAGVEMRGGRRGN